MVLLMSRFNACTYIHHQGLLTLVIGLFAWVLMPAGPCQTPSWFRGKDGWFSEREEKIIVNRVIREDPGKSSMHNREPVTPKLLWQSLKDYDLWLVPTREKRN